MRPTVVLAALVLTVGCATGRTGLPAPAAPLGYLTSPQVQGIADGMEAPRAGWVPDDRETFDKVPPGTDHWWLAIAHAELRPPEAAQHFDCALQTRLAQTPRPALTRLMQRLSADADAVTRTLAAETPRSRPIKRFDDLQPCQRIDETTRDGPSWPAGGAAVGAAYGEMFAALAPDRADAVRRIGHEIGLSRTLCRMNWRSDVEDGATVGRTIFAAASRDPAFQADLAAARLEVDAARAEGLTHPGCAAERRALSQIAGQAGRGATREP